MQESALPLADEILVTRTFLDDKQGQLNEFEPLGPQGEANCCSMPN